MGELYIGLMSGTSLDGIDAVLVDFSQHYPKLLDAYYSPYEPELRQSILALCHPGIDEINRLGKMDRILGKQFANAVLHLLKKNQLTPDHVRAIGSHGQTIRHHPAQQFTLQIGDPNIIAAETGITTIADFRRRDIALHGQGAPLVPAFHQTVFSADVDRIILNIGGIANMTLLPKNSKTILGFDTGPGNTLLDAWAEKHLQQPKDQEGHWGKQGILQNNLLNDFMRDPFFKQSPPKSTGREYFNLNWLNSFSLEKYLPVDVQATLTELTAKSILDAIPYYFSNDEIVVCGGGVHNTFLLERLRALGPHYKIESSEKYGIHPDWVEAMAFAWLAKQTLTKAPGNVISVTGATQASILGGVYFA